jgi:AraC-like DNA-binding protein
MIEWMPRFLSCVHWVCKEQFLLDVDTYDRWVMFAVEDGAFSYKIGDRRGVAGFGDLVLCPPGVAFHRKVETALTFLFFQLEWVDVMGRARGGGEISGLPAGKISLHDRSRLTSTYALLNMALAGDEEQAKWPKNHCLQDLWLQHCAESAASRNGGGGQAASGASTEMQEARARIEAAALQPLNLRDVAEGLRMSPAQLTKRFSKTFGEAPIRYVTALRMEAAKKLLRETRLTLEQISERCGYPNGFYLNRVFVRQTGQTPSQYRKLHRI